MLCAPRATGYSAANSSTRLDSTQFGPARVGALLLLLLLTCPCSASVRAVESFNSVRSAEVGGRTTRKKLALLGHRQCPDMRPGTWRPGYWGTLLRAPRHMLRVAGTSLS